MTSYLRDRTLEAQGSRFRDYIAELSKGAAQRGLLAVFDTVAGDHELVKRNRGELARLIH